MYTCRNEHDRQTEVDQSKNERIQSGSILKSFKSRIFQKVFSTVKSTNSLEKREGSGLVSKSNFKY